MTSLEDERAVLGGASPVQLVTSCSSLRTPGHSKDNLQASLTHFGPICEAQLIERSMGI